MLEKIKDKVIFETIKKKYTHSVPYHELLGLKVSKFDFESAEITLSIKNELLGNVSRGFLHGGVTASMLDSIGGLVAIGDFIANNKDKSPDYLKSSINHMGTIDIRIDYLLPGEGTMFTANGRVIRAGKRVTVCRMEMLNDKNECIALGTGTYLWSK
jgi:uncharacterized protein (TIGR00369 family)